MGIESSAIRGAEREAVGLIAKAARSALRDAAPVFRRAAERRGLPSTAKDALRAAEDRATAKVGAAGRDAAQRVASLAREAEKDITPKLQRIVDRTPGIDRELFEQGLAHKLKAPDSLERKIAMDVVNGDSLATAEHGINDAVRYTITSSREEYGRVTQQAIDKMKDAGFEPVSSTNFWGQEGYQGINTVWRDGDHTFEMQFHTPESLAAKEETHLIYEMARVFPKGDADGAALRSIQNTVFDGVHRPPGASSIDPRAG